VSAGERGPLKASENGVTRAAVWYFLGSLQHTIDERGVIDVEAWNSSIELARDLAAERPSDNI
jgi:hypothetical protein